mmetsp:Transcript_105067/g.307008  ORF Transcript_105067/g.307008 Transcript_105067/m.307008 type:complete len:141 (-) Transcript_105067:48-470(-)
MVRFLVLLLAASCVAIEAHNWTTVPREFTASGTDVDEDVAALLQLSNRDREDPDDHDYPSCCDWDAPPPHTPKYKTCCAYCLNDKGHHDKRICITKTATKHDRRPFCDDCGGIYNPGGCWEPSTEHGTDFQYRTDKPWLC